MSAKKHELLPCPFCGAQPFAGPAPTLTNSRVKSVSCGQCGAEGPAKPKAAGAAAGWNRREPEPHAKLLSEARDVLYQEYLSGGGDEEAKGNPHMERTGKLIDRIDRALATSR